MASTGHVKIQGERSPTRLDIGIMVSALVALATAIGCWVFGYRDWACGIAAGIAISIANYGMWKFIIARFLGVESSRKGWVPLLFLAKIGLNTAVLAAVIIALKINPVALMAGLGAGVLGLSIGGLVAKDESENVNV